MGWGRTPIKDLSTESEKERSADATAGMRDFHRPDALRQRAAVSSGWQRKLCWPWA
jgi:hypothetical protein